ncbi:MAG: PQQ-dependent sugar dehydrogenase [Pseudomarimonas sp.]
MHLNVPRTLLTAWLLSLTVTACAQTHTAPQTLASGLNHPWSLALLPDGRILISERAGHLRLLENGELRAEPLTGLPPIHVRGQAGLFDLLPAKDFASSGWLYFSYAHGNAGASTTRVARAKLIDNALTDLEVLFTAQASRNTSAHYGGRLGWMADGSLLLTLGDGFDSRERAQALDDHFGKIVRINADGSVPKDNPFVGQADVRPEIYSYGHRNVQGLAVITAADGSEQVYAHEHGPRGGDELNRIQPGKNYGWPLATFGIDYSGAQISPFTELANTQPPLLYWTPSIAPAGLAYYDDARFPAWQGSFFVAALAERCLRQVRLKPDGSNEQIQLLDELGERLRDVRVGPEGALYVLTDSDNGRLLRLAPPGE